MEVFKLAVKISRRWVLPSGQLRTVDDRHFVPDVDAQPRNNAFRYTLSLLLRMPHLPRNSLPWKVCPRRQNPYSPHEFWDYQTCALLRGRMPLPFVLEGYLQSALWNMHIKCELYGRHSLEY